MIARLLIAVISFGAGVMLAPKGFPVKEVIITERVEVPVVREMTLEDLPLAWQKLAKCESSGRPDAVSGTRKQFQGAFQIEYPRTWVAHGGHSGTPPKKATLKEQFHVALHIYADRGAKPWPYCGKFLKAEYGR